ncbi:MAG: protein kinase [Planctomycetes bacterium]|nr:protein kinase [Planctomycetota bacterium]
MIGLNGGGGGSTMDTDIQTEQEKTPEKRVAVVCPQCFRAYKIAPSLIGKRLVCKDCRHEWRARRGTAAELRSSIHTRKLREHSSDLSRSPNGSSDMPPSAGSSVAIDMSWAGRKIGRYRARSLLGYGGMGVVWRAHDDALRRDVALKILSRTRDQNKNGGLNLDLFMQEARAVAKLQHPSVVSIFEVAEDEGHVFLSLELMEGGTLKEFVDKNGKIEPRKLFEWMVGPAKALALAHRRGVIHRDIKPGNLMLDDHGHLKLMDFGLADVTNEEVSERLRGKAVGSLGWVAPETAKGQPTTPVSDLYCLGLVMHYALTGKPLIHGKSRSEIIALHQNPPDARLDEIEGLSHRGKRLMRKLLSVDPALRFQSADELAADLADCAGEDPSERVRRTKKGVSIAVIATILGIFAGVGVTLYYLLDLMNQQESFNTPAPVIKSTSGSHDKP